MSRWVDEWTHDDWKKKVRELEQENAELKKQVETLVDKVEIARELIDEKAQENAELEGGGDD